ncbi:MAG: hypothetical protein OXF20_15615 [Gammaproteobacteria bacterium]|nr:hypothetical protein [Gammaproteobacteria bacterium]
MEGECEQVEGQQYVRQPLPAVTEVVFDMTVLVPGQAEGLVLDLPAGASAPDEFPDVVGAGLQGGDEAEAGGGLSFSRPPDFGFDVPGFEGFPVGGQRQSAFAPPVAIPPVGIVVSRSFNEDGPGRALQSVEAIEQGGLVVGLDTQHSVAHCCSATGRQSRFLSLV